MAAIVRLTKRQRELLRLILKKEAKLEADFLKIYLDAEKINRDKIARLLARTDFENMTTIRNQALFQSRLRDELRGIIIEIDSKNYQYLKDYTLGSFSDGFVGGLYSMQGQGVPFVFPKRNERTIMHLLDLDASVFADTYKRVGLTPAKLHARIRGEIGRRIAAGESWDQAAKVIYETLSGRMAITRRAALTVCRTVGHTAQQHGRLEAMQEAAALGAKVHKQWDSTLDGLTRPWHWEANGQEADIDGYFHVGGELLPAPGIGGSAENVMNCRCQVIERANWTPPGPEYKMLNRVSNMSEERKEDMARRLMIPKEDLSKFEGHVVPINAKSYEEFKKEYEKLNF